MRTSRLTVRIGQIRLFSPPVTGKKQAIRLTTCHTAQAPMTTHPEQPISIRCGACDKSLKASAKLAGKRVKCPCGAAIDVPAIDSGIGIKRAFSTSPSEQVKHEKQNPNLIQCPDCNAHVSKRAESCPKCGAPLGVAPTASFGVLDLPATAAFSQPSYQPLSHPTNDTFSFQQVGEGKYLCSGSYERLFVCAQQALTMSNVNIKQASQATGEIQGNARYGINAFGMSIYARIYASGMHTTVEFAASFSDAFDTAGACKKKVRQISENFAQLIHASGSSTAVTGVPAMLHVRSGAPVASEQIGQSFKGKAVTGFWLSLAGLLFAPCAILGFIMSGQAYASINSSNNQEGRGWALAGSIVGFLVLLLWAFFVLGIMAS
jgi:ribosomal protein L40E